MCVLILGPPGPLTLALDRSQSLFYFSWNFLHGMIISNQKLLRAPAQTATRKEMLQSVFFVSSRRIIGESSSVIFSVIHFAFFLGWMEFHVNKDAFELSCYWRSFSKVSSNTTVCLSIWAGQKDIWHLKSSSNPKAPSELANIRNSKLDFTKFKTSTTSSSAWRNRICTK